MALLIAYAGLSAFVVTLGMLSIARSAAIVLVGKPDDLRLRTGGADVQVARPARDIFGMSKPLFVLVILAVIIGIVLKFTTWGRHLYAIGGNEHAARLTGVPVDRGQDAGLHALRVHGRPSSALLTVGWQGSAINALGTSYELRVIASTVIGGANLMGGEGGAYGAVAGAALLEVIRNGLLMEGIDSNWQGAFVGVFIILAVLLEKIRGRRRA